ncbi:MAG: hypothetical protein ACE5I5_18240 [Candidatus Heimdallarchaeota archaeon]
MEDPSGLQPAYEEALSANSPAIIDLIIDHQYYPTRTHRVFLKHKRKKTSPMNYNARKDMVTKTPQY